jgi:hypothetical protein
MGLSVAPFKHIAMPTVCSTLMMIEPVTTTVAIMAVYV